jgi:wobble nucleotide-excising tRNase
MPISKLHLEKVASFTKEGGIDVSDLKKINFFFGTNGCGKTTISRVLDNSKFFPYCHHDCPENEKILVYNEDFKQKQIFETDIKGVFTLGEESKEIELEIKENIKTIDENSRKISELQFQIEDKESALKINEDKLKDKVWKKKGDLELKENGFKEAFQGFRNSVTSFYDKLLSERNTNKSILLDKEELFKKGKSILGEIPIEMHKFFEFDFSDIPIIETNELLEKSIVGKKDVDIAHLILRLENSDWVKAGIPYLSEGSESCPFCQTKLDTQNLKSALLDYFDETYEKQVSSLKKTQRKAF